MDASGLLPIFRHALLGFDSFVAGLLIGPRLRARQRWVLFVVSLGLCDGVGTWAGVLLPRCSIDISFLTFYALVVPAVIVAARGSARWWGAIPVLLALDNLLAGAPLGSAPDVAISSASMAAVGVAVSCAAWWAAGALARRLGAPSGHAYRQV